MTPLRRTKVGLAHRARPEPSDDEVVWLVERALEPLGGLRFFLPDDATVVLKPNQTLFFHAKDGVTTDPRVVAALVRLAKEAGAKRVVVGDGAGGDLRSARVMAITGVERLARAAGADEVVGFEDLDHVSVPVDVRGRRHQVPVPRILLDADLVVNVPKVKTHFEDPISCSLKNWVGVIHQEARPRFMDDPLLYEVIAELHRAVPAHLHVADGLWAGVGQGPAANRGEWLGCIVAGDDPVAVDHVVGRLMGLGSRRFRFQEAAERVGLGTRDPVAIDVVGPEVGDVAIEAEPSREGLEHLPIRVLIGGGVSWAGSLGHFKSLAEVFDRFGLWQKIERIYGTPTFMIGRVHDPDFERFAEAGPYFVIDDVAHDEYRNDPRTTAIPGHPATHNIFPALFDRLHVPNMGPAAMGLAKIVKRLDALYHFRSWQAPAGRTGRGR